MAGTAYDGPKTATAEQLDDVVALANSVFRREGGDMAAEFPLLFHPQRTEQLHIFTHRGRPVSLVGVTVNDVTMLGCPTRIACLGSVCTAEAHRKRGLAGHLVNAAAAAARDQGASVLLISGGRTLYARRGAVDAGAFLEVSLAPEQIACDAAGLAVERLNEGDCEAALRLFEAEPVRFRRCVEDYAATVHCRCETRLARRGGEPVAVASLAQPKEKQVRLVEFAGSRPAVAAIVAGAARDSDAQRVTVRGYPWDRGLRDVFLGWSVKPELRTFRGTVKLLDPARLWEDFRPLLSERIGAEAAASIEVHAEADALKIHTLTFRRAGEEITLCRAAALTAALLGHPKRRPLGRNSRGLGGVLKRALPVPLPMYGLNYV